VARRCDDTVDKKRVNSSVLKHLFSERVEQPKISPKKPGNALSDAPLMSCFQNFAADTAIKTLINSLIRIDSGPKIPRSCFIPWRFVESVKNAWWLMSPQAAGDGLESIVEFQAQIKGHNQPEFEDKWQGWQNWTDEKLATKLMKDDQQPVLLLPARWWPDTLPEFESGGLWQRPHTRVRCRQCKCSLVENPSFRSSKCHGCEKQMKTKVKDWTV